MHHQFIIGLLQIVAFTLGAEAIQNQQKSGMERSMSEGLKNGHLKILRQFLNLQESGLDASEWLKLLEQLLNNFESRMGAVEGKTSSLEGKTSSLGGKMNTLEGKTSSLEGEMNTLEGKTSSLESEMNTVKGKVEILDQSRCQTEELSTGYNNFQGEWRTQTHNVTFQSPFHRSPKVIVSLMEYDMSRRPYHNNNDDNPSWQNIIQSVNKKGFKLLNRAMSEKNGVWMINEQTFRWMACA